MTMRVVYVIRHAEKDSQSGELTETGKQKALELQKKLPRFDLVIASDSPRTQETALILSGRKAAVDTRVGFFNATAKQSEILNKQAESHPFGFTGALLDTKELEVGVEAKAEDLVDFIFKTIEGLGPEGKALIVSHDITMVPAANLITNNSISGPLKTFPFLGGFVVDEARKISPFQL